MEVGRKLHSQAALFVKKDLWVTTWLGNWVSTRYVFAQEMRISFQIISRIGNRTANPWLSSSQYNLDTH